MRTSLLLLIVVVGCGGTGDDDDSLAPFVSGARLRALYQDGGDGAISLTGWRDLELDVVCAFFTADDDVLRCLPTQGAGVLFLDSDCTERATTWDPRCSDIPRYLHAGSASGCASGFRVGGYEVGAQVEVDSVWTLDVDGTCWEQPIGEGTQTVYRITAMPPERFAGATPRRVDVGGGLGVEVLETEDGASALGGLYRTDDGRACQAFDLDPSETVCVAGTLAYSFADYHTDPDCSNADVVSASDGPGCPDPDLAVVYHSEPGSTCGVLNGTLTELGEPLDPSEVYGGQGAAACQAVGDDPNRRFFAVGAAVASEPPPVTAGWRGAGRMHVGYRATADGLLLNPAGIWRDDTEGRSCFVYRTTADGLRCLPDYGSLDDIQSFWADEDCSADRLVPTFLSPCEPDRPPATIAVRFETVGCDGQAAEAFDLGAPHDGAVWSSSGTGDCTPVEPSPDRTFYPVEGPHPLTDFAAIEVVEE